MTLDDGGMLVGVAGHRIPVSVAEVLEVVGGGVDETAVWALLHQAVRPLQSLIADVHQKQVTSCAFSPETCFVFADGSVEIKPMHTDTVDARFTPATPSDHADSNFVYSLGAVLWYALEYSPPSGDDTKTDEVRRLDASPQLLSLLNLMIVNDANIRPTVGRLKQMVKQQVLDRNIDPVDVVSKIHYTIIGDEDELPADDAMLSGSDIEDATWNGRKDSLPFGDASPEPAFTANKLDQSPPSPALLPEPEPEPVLEAAMMLPNTDYVETLRRHDDDDLLVGGASAIRFPSNSTSEHLPLTESASDLPPDVKPAAPVSPSLDHWVHFEERTLAVAATARQPPPTTRTPVADDEAESQGQNKSDVAYYKTSVDPFVSPREQAKEDSPTLIAPRHDAFGAPQPATARAGGGGGEFGPSCSRGRDGRSCHSLNCEFCSPERTTAAEDAKKGSMPNLATRDLTTAASFKESDEDKWSVDGDTPLVNQQDRPVIAAAVTEARDPFGGSFLELTSAAARDRLPLTAQLRRTEEADSFYEPMVIRKRVHIKQPSTDSETEPVMVMPQQRTTVKDEVAITTADVIGGAIKPTPAPRVMRNTELDRIAIVADERAECGTGEEEAPEQQTAEVEEVKVSNDDENKIPLIVSTSDDTNTPVDITPDVVPLERPVTTSDSSKPKTNEDGGTGDIVAAVTTEVQETESNHSRIPVEPVSRTSSVRKMGGPEFLFKSRLPSIRLKAPAVKRRRTAVGGLLSGKAEQSDVQVVLLNGQRVDVTCQTDADASDVFELVVGHINLNEHFFFGLTVLKDGEHFFLEPEQKLHKFAPPGWKHPRRHLSAKNVYTLYLRMKNYPTTLDFVKTDQTLHEMYLQLRRDAIDERMQTGRDNAYQLASLALQAECGDRPSAESTSYFHPDHYLPHRNIVEEFGGEERVKTVLSELHSQYAGMSMKEAEVEYLKMCQAQREYGVHFHRVYRQKPAAHLGNTPLGDPETGTPLWVGIKPQGIVVFEERRGVRQPLSRHRWQDTDTLQFDKKRFVIVPRPAAPDGAHTAPAAAAAEKLVFYTDNYKKSSYFVKFAASQHRFCMKMRSWAVTLMADPANRSAEPPLHGEAYVGRQANSLGSADSAKSADSGAPDLSREPSPDEKGRLAAGAPAAVAATSAGGAGDRVTLYSSAKPKTLDDSATASPTTTPRYAKRANEPAARVIDMSIPSHDRTNVVDASDVAIEDESLLRRFDAVAPSALMTGDESVGRRVCLIKHQSYGLGLTLVDGEVDGVKGVYVKSLTPGGPAALQGHLQHGDRLLSINGVSLTGRNRHDAVTMVKECGAKVELEVVRLLGTASSGASPLSEDDTVSSAVPPPYKSHVAEEQRRAKSDMGTWDQTLPSLDSSALITQQTMLERRHSLEAKERRAGHASKSVTLPSDLKEICEQTPQPSVGNIQQRLGVPKEDGVRHHHHRSNAGSTNTMSSSVSSRSSGEFHFETHDAVDSFGLHSEDLAYNNDSLMTRSALTTGDVSHSVFDDTTGSGTKLSHPSAGGATDATSPARRYVDGARRHSSKILYPSHASSSSEDNDHNDSAEYAGRVTHARNGGEPSSTDAVRRRSSHSGSDGEAGGAAVRRWGNPDHQSTPIAATSMAQRGAGEISNGGAAGERRQPPPLLAPLRSADWTNSIDMHKELPSSDEDDQQMELFEVVLQKAPDGGLGLKVAGGRQRAVYIKSLVRNPALSCPNLRPGDRLLAVNGVQTKDLDHQDVADLLRDARSPVTLGLARQTAPKSPTVTVETLAVTLEKSATGSLGLSLAKLTNAEGIFIRVITPGGVAAQEGSLREGDRLWEFNGESVAEASPLDVIEKIKSASGRVALVVKRFRVRYTPSQYERYNFAYC